MIFLDTNIIIRYLTADDKIKAKKCFKLLEKIKNNQIQAFLTETVFAEIVYILSSPKLYNLSPPKIKLLLEPIINLKGLKIDQNLFLNALESYETFKIDIEDALLAAQMHKKKARILYSYDRDFDKIPSVKRKEPV
jgi:predicted nucleic acid-binding protein